MVPDSQSVKTEFPPGNVWHQFLLFALSELWPVKGERFKSGRLAVWFLLSPASEGWEGNIFTGVCLFTGKGGVPPSSVQVLSG